MSHRVSAGESRRFRIVVFASGNGSNFQAIVDAVKQGVLDLEIALLVCDRAQAKVIERAQEAGVPTWVFKAKDFASRELADQHILEGLKQAGAIDLIVLAGYMRIITEVLVQPHYGRIINVHPSLLPLFPGLHAVKQALDHGVKVTGTTVHFVDGGMDTGPIIAQEAIHIHNDETETSLTAKVQQIEHRLLPRVIEWIQHGRVKLDGHKVTVI